MPHLTLVALSGFRVRERDMLALGMSLPGLQQRAQAIGALPSLGLLTLAALTPEPWTVSYHDPCAVTDGIVGAILAEHPTLVGISALTASIEEAYRLADTLRESGIAVVLGGLHVTACPAEAEAHAAVVIGDGEPVWAQVLADAHADRLRPRYRAAQPFDLRTAPVPRFALLADRPRARYTLQTARGCPMACDFCGASRLLGPYREKPAAAVARELEAIRAVAARAYIELADDNTFAVRRDAPDLLDVLERSGVRYFTEADWRIGERPEILERLAPSGCVQVLVGVESLAPRYRGMGSKSAALGRVMDALGGLQDSGVAAIGCFIVGGDGEDLESMAALGEFLLDCPLADIQLTLQTPFPGTALHDRLAREGRLLTERGWSAYTLFDATHRPDRLSVEQLESGFRNLVRMVFAEEPSRRRAEIRRQIWSRRAGVPA
jgi:radical SAM superfamily enzyme YgiQ (UPF0313 family)